MELVRRVQVQFLSAKLKRNICKDKLFLRALQLKKLSFLLSFCFSLLIPSVVNHVSAGLSWVLEDGYGVLYRYDMVTV